MKDKNIAGILSLFLGWLGIHRFYLGQAGLGIVYLLLFWTPVIWILSLIDAIAFFSMDQENFDYKYNRQFIQQQGRQRRDTDFDRRDYDRRSRRYDRRERREQREDYRRDRRAPKRPEYRKPTPPPPAPKRHNPYKTSGIKKYKEFDYDGAIEDFLKALEIDKKDIAVHFNLACAYSLNEEKDKAFHHLDKAVDNGFNDFRRIKEHDAFAYLRIQPEFEEFEKNGFRLIQKLEAPKQELLDTPLAATDPASEEATNASSDLLEQLQKLGELKEKGLLTEEEFVAQKKKLLS